MIDEYLKGIGSEALRKTVRRLARGGIYCWGAESALILSGEGDYYRRFRDQAEAEDPGNARLLGIEWNVRKRRAAN